MAESQGNEVPYVVNILPEENGSWLFHVPNASRVPEMAE